MSGGNKRTVHIVVPVIIEVDADAWNAEYGNNESAAEIRASIKSGVLDAVDGAYAYLTDINVITWLGREG